MEFPFIHVGSTQEAIKEARMAIMAIMDAQRSDQVVLEALRAFTDVSQVKNVEISNNTFNDPKD